MLDFQLRHIPHVGVGIDHHEPGLRQLVGGLFVITVLCDYVGQVALRLGYLAILGAVVDYGGVSHLLREVLEVLFQLVQFFLILHVRR